MPRSTRNKMRHQAAQAAKCQDKAMEHLKALSDMAEDRSDVVNTLMPSIVTMLDGVKKNLIMFREKL